MPIRSAACRIVDPSARTRSTSTWNKVSRSSKGKSIANLVNMGEGEKMAALLRVQDFPEEEGKRFIVMKRDKNRIARIRVRPVE